MLVGYAVKLVSITALYIYMYLENKRRDREAATEVSEDPVKDGIEQGMLVSGHSVCLLVLEMLTHHPRIKRSLKTRHLDTCYEHFWFSRLPYRFA